MTPEAYLEKYGETAQETWDKADAIIELSGLSDSLRDLERAYAPGADAQAKYDALPDDGKEEAEAMIAEGLKATLAGARKHTSKMLIRMGLGKHQRRHVRRLQKRGDTEKLSKFWLEFHRTSA